MAARQDDDAAASDPWSGRSGGWRPPLINSRGLQRNAYTAGWHLTDDPSRMPWGMYLLRASNTMCMGHPDQKPNNTKYMQNAQQGRDRAAPARRLVDESRPG